MRNATAKEMLEDALDLVSHKGWWVQESYCETGGVCAMGALAVAAGYLTPVKRNGELVFDMVNVPDVCEYMPEHMGNAAYEEATCRLRDAILAGKKSGALIRDRVASPEDEYPSAVVITFNDADDTSQTLVVNAFKRAVKSFDKEN